LARPQDVTMPPFVDFLYLIPNDSLHIELNFANLNDVRLSGGKSAEINRDFYKYFNATGYRTIGRNYGVGTDMEMNASWAEIVNKLNEKRNEFHNRRQTFLQKNDVSDEVVFLTEAMIELDYYTSLAKTVVNRKYILNIEATDNQIFLNELNDVSERYFYSGLYSNAHFDFIGSYISIAYLATGAERGSLENFIDMAKEVAPTETLQDFLLTVQAGRALRAKNLDAFEKIAAHIDDEYLLDRVMQEYRTTRRNMLNPDEISSYILTGSSRELTTSLSLRQNNPLAKIIVPGSGNVQIVNLSAYWCVPCHPVLAELRLIVDEYADKNVTFSFIASNNAHNRKMYEDIGIDPSLIYYLSDEEYQFMVSTFSPFSIPYGVLTNRKGVIVDYGSHVRPQTGLREKVDLLLRQDNLVK
jgi:thiol-disulfide isomerase/thioredoxin